LFALFVDWLVGCLIGWWVCWSNDFDFMAWSFDQQTHHPIKHNQPTNQQTMQTISQLTRRPAKQSTNQQNDQPANQRMSQPAIKTNQPS
jgi:hypothetical protein